MSTSDRRAAWRELYAKRLPALAKAKDPAQRSWPVTLDHCFGRIILDSVIGKGETAWNEQIKGPAIRSMSDTQIEACIALGEQIASGKADLVQLDEQSLAARGKKSKHFTKQAQNGANTPTKRKRDARGEHSKKNIEPSKKTPRGSEDDLPLDDAESQMSDEHYSDTPQSTPPTTQPSEQAVAKQSTKNEDQQNKEKAEELGKRSREGASLEELQKLVKSSTLIESRKAILLALLQVPRGKYTTYGAISDFLGSSPRAIGNGMRNNPFAPEVPCHRVLAADGKIGGYCGQWGEGNLIDKKRKILREEGVRFDGSGKVVGGPWRGFK